MNECITMLYNMRLLQAINGARALILYFQTNRLISFHPIQNQSQGEFLFRTVRPGQVWGCSCLLHSCLPVVNRHSERSAVAREKTSLQLHSILSYPPKSCHAMYLEVIYTSLALFPANKAIKLFTFGNLGGNSVFGECRKSLNSLITLYMYAIMSYNTILSCISKSGTPFSPTKGKASMERPVPPFIKASEKAPLFKECHLRESCKH